MKSSLAISALLSTGLAASIPRPQPVCTFNARALNGAVDSFESSVERRDLGQTTWNPPSNLVTPLKQVWDHEMATYPANFKNYGYDQIMDAKGKINYCVRWQGTKPVTAEMRAQTEAAIRKAYNKWIAVLAGFEKFPYKTAEVNVVGWAVQDKSILQGDVSKIQVYTDKDGEGIPQCSEKCGRFFHQDNNYSGCPAGAARHYDLSLWLTPGMNGGAGGDWGQRIGQEYFLQSINSENIHILLHELGHTFALDDFYDWTPSGVTNFIMLAGSAMEITEFDAWMARDWWRNLKSRYGL
ncbi:hypothetical protein CC80DRAFT_463089 [Byssothecium circinans]|uniref:Cellulose-binding family II protein n=1 Tax=Byssothecium circinans TaxID=147558 RepID=A0A6A5UAE8_9PLEO|nr:hypothetical protein CC80DRAFT_463089 [Byssothecium circinans]